MNILVYSFNDKIGDGLQKITFIQKLKELYPHSHLTYSTTYTTTLKETLSPLVKGFIDEFIEYNEIESSFFALFKKKNKFIDREFDLIIDLQKVVLRTLNLKKIPHKNFFSTCANFMFSDYKNNKSLIFKGIYIEKFYFNILSLIINKNFVKIPNIKIPKNKLSDDIIKTNKDKNIAIAPGAGNSIRQWDFKKYLEIANILRNRGFNIYFFLGPQEKDYLRPCLENNFLCPEWKDGKMISNNITFTMQLAEKMTCLLCNDGGTAWMFEFAGVKTLKIFGVTDEKKFARPDYCKTIQIRDYGIKNIKDFSIEAYTKNLDKFLENV
tara:strand:+ start:381 stop:1352 length:972 start_codon:yes stop_codon:yes gene_type:complete